MREQDVTTLLTRVGVDLEEMGLQEPIRLLLIGGAYMITQVHNRAVTDDIDAALLGRNRWGDEYDLFRRVMEFDLTEIGGNVTWFSDDITEFLPLMGMPKSSTLWLSSGKLEVYIPDAGYILVLKLLSGRKKDQKDIRSLCKIVGVKNRVQAEMLLNQYVSDDIRGEYAEKIEIVMKKAFPG